MSDEILAIIFSAIFSGTVSTFATVAALKVHINYLRETIHRHEKDIARLWERVK